MSRCRGVIFLLWWASSSPASAGEPIEDALRPQVFVPAPVPRIAYECEAYNSCWHAVVGAYVAWREGGDPTDLAWWVEAVRARSADVESRVLSEAPSCLGERGEHSTSECRLDPASEADAPPPSCRRAADQPFDQAQLRWCLSTGDVACALATMGLRPTSSEYASAGLAARAIVRRRNEEHAPVVLQIEDHVVLVLGHARGADGGLRFVLGDVAAGSDRLPALVETCTTKQIDGTYTAGDDRVWVYDVPDVPARPSPGERWALVPSLELKSAEGWVLDRARLSAEAHLAATDADDACALWLPVRESELEVYEQGAPGRRIVALSALPDDAVTLLGTDALGPGPVLVAVDPSCRVGKPCDVAPVLVTR